jgi:hypothetical protein
VVGIVAVLACTGLLVQLISVSILMDHVKWGIESMQCCMNDVLGSVPVFLPGLGRNIALYMHIFFLMIDDSCSSTLTIEGLRYVGMKT